MLRRSFFSNRYDAGRRLALSLRARGVVPEGAVCVAIAGGGIAVGYEVAARLALPLTALPVERLYHPLHAGVPIGAMALGGTVIQSDLGGCGLDAEWLDQATLDARERLQARAAVCGLLCDQARIAGAPIVLIDDGSSTGLALRAAVAALHAHGVGTIVIALPVAPRGVLHELANISDVVHVLHPVVRFWGSVGAYYKSYPRVSDTAVAMHLSLAAAAPSRNDRVERAARRSAYTQLLHPRVPVRVRPLREWRFHPYRE